MDESFAPHGRGDENFAPLRRGDESFAPLGRGDESFATLRHGDGGTCVPVHRCARAGSFADFDSWVI